MDKQTEKFSQVQKLTEDQAKTEQSVKVVVSKSPLDKPHVEFIRPDVSCYDAVHKFLSDICVYNNENIVLELNGKPLQESDHSRILKHDDLLVVAVRPADPVSLGTFITTALISVAVSVVAGVIAYNLFKPDEPDAQDDDRLSAISGMRNRKRPYEPVRAVLGKRQIAPDYWAEPYTYRRGDDEWFRALLCVGYGPLEIRDMKVGETPFKDLEGNIAVLDYYENKDITTVKALWPSDVVEDVPSITLLKGDTASRTTAVNPDKISLEFLLPRGMAKGSGYNASSIQHQYTTNESPSRNIKILRLFRGGVVAPTGSGTSGTKFRPLPYALIQINDGSYRLCQGGEGDRNPWDRTDGHGVTQGDRIFGGRNNRSILRRSWTFPSEAIVKVEGTGNNRLMHIDMDVLDGTPRFIWERTGTDDDGDGIYEIVQDGTYTVDQPLAAIAFASSRTRQRRFDFEYHPIGDTDSQTISTETVKLYPNETPDDASNISEWNWTKFRTVRNLTDAQFRNLIGYAKPELEYKYNDGTDVKVGNFRPVIIALELKATDQLSGALDNFNVVASTVVPNDWNYDWRRMIELNQNQLHPTENPAEVYRWLLQGPITDAPNGNERVDLEEILDWKDYCDEPYITGEYDGPQWRVSYEAIQQQTIQELLNKVAYTGRAEFAYTDRGQYGVLQKTRRDVPVQIITPKNSWDFEAARVFPEIDDGIKFKFDNELEEYQEDEDVFYDPRVENRRGRFKGQTIQGVPSRDIAYRIARFSYYEEAFQREIYKASMDVEGMVMKRGSLAYLQNDVIDVGLGAGRVLGVDGTDISIDETIDLDVGTEDYGFVFRQPDGTLTDITPAQYLGDGVIRLNQDLSNTIQEGDFYTYGLLDSETNVVQVIAMDFGEDNVVRLTFVNYDGTLYDIDEAQVGDDDYEPIPEFQTNLTDRIEFQIPNPPQLTLPDNLGSVDIATQQFYLDLEYESQFENSTDLFTFQVRTAVPEGDPELDEEFDDRLLSLEPEYDESEPWEFAGSIPSQETQFVYQGVERGTGYRVRARSRSQNGDFSPYSIPVNVVIPLSFPPNNVQDVGVTDTIEGVLLDYPVVVDPDLADYEVRTNTAVGEANGLLLNTTQNRNVNIGFNIGESTYYLYARTRFDIYSENGREVIVPPFYTPTVVSNIQVSYKISGAILAWDKPLPSVYFKPEYTQFYEIHTSANRTEDTLVGTTSTRSFNVGLPENDEDRTFYIFTVSISGEYSNAIAVLVVGDVYAPSPVNNLIVEYSKTQNLLRWDAPIAGVLEFIDRYEVWDSTDLANPNRKLAETTINRYDVGVPEFRVTREFFVYVVSITGVYSDAADILTEDVYTPPTPVAATISNTANGTVINWDEDNANGYDYAGLLEIYEIRTNNTVGTPGGLVGTTSGTSLNVGFPQDAVEREFFVFGKAVTGFYSLQPLIILIDNSYFPPIPVVRAQQDSKQGSVIRWQQGVDAEFENSNFDFYEIRTNTNFGSDDGLINRQDSGQVNIGFVDGSNPTTYYVYTVSVAGYTSPPLLITPVAPIVEVVQNLFGVPIDNTVALDWVDPVNNIYPISGYEVQQRQPGRVEFVKVGRFSGTYANITEREGGNYVFRVRTVDAGNNTSDFISIPVRVFDPGDFVLLFEQDADFSQGVAVGGAIRTNEGDLAGYFPLYYNHQSLDKTLNDRIQEAATASSTTFGAVTIQDKINNIGPWIPQKTMPADGSDLTEIVFSNDTTILSNEDVITVVGTTGKGNGYQQIFDLFNGEVGLVNSTTIAVNIDSTQLAALDNQNDTVMTRTFIEWTDDIANGWSDRVEATQIFVQEEFRFVRVTLQFDVEGNTNGLPYIRLNEINLAIDVKQVTDQGESDIVGADDPSFPTEISFRTLRDVQGNQQNYFTDVLSVTGTVEEFDPTELQNPNRVTEILSNGKILNKGEIVTVKTEFEYLATPGDESTRVFDKFRAYAQGPDGRFIPARISWIARGIANITD